MKAQFWKMVEKISQILKLIAIVHSSFKNIFWRKKKRKTNGFGHFSTYRKLGTTMLKKPILLFGTPIYVSL